ncbi:MAG: RNA polymerase sigma factor [Myxococcales bacterium]|nr:RNA polymerase sigma factor [Myxococcales bacterium]
MNEITQELVARAVDGDPAAIHRIVAVLERPFFHLALRMLMQHDDAEEACQEALLRVITRLSSWRGESQFATWAWSVATRCVLDYGRGRARRPLLAFEDFEADLADARDDSARERVEDAVLLAQVKVGCARAMLQCLDADHRVAYVLGEILEVEGPQAAAALNLTPAAFRKRLSRARQRLAQTLTRSCGVRSADNPCRCHKRLAPARAKGRLDPRDAAELELPALRERVRSLEELSATHAFFEADPQGSVAERVLPHVHRALGL